MDGGEVVGRLGFTRRGNSSINMQQYAPPPAASFNYRLGGSGCPPPRPRQDRARSRIRDLRNDIVYSRLVNGDWFGSSVQQKCTRTLTGLISM